MCAMTGLVDEVAALDIFYLYLRKAFVNATHQIVTEKHGLEEPEKWAEK